MPRECDALKEENNVQKCPMLELLAGNRDLATYRMFECCGLQKSTRANILF